MKIAKKEYDETEFSMDQVPETIPKKKWMLFLEFRKALLKIKYGPKYEDSEILKKLSQKNVTLSSISKIFGKINQSKNKTKKQKKTL